MIDHNRDVDVSLSNSDTVDRSKPGIYDVSADPHTGAITATFVVPGLTPEAEEFATELHTQDFDVWGVDAFDLKPDRTTVTVGKTGNDIDAAQALVDDLQVRVREIYEDELPVELFDEWTVYHISATMEGITIDAEIYADDLDSDLFDGEHGIGVDDLVADASVSDLSTEALLRELEARIHRSGRDVQ